MGKEERKKGETYPKVSVSAEEEELLSV